MKITNTLIRRILFVLSCIGLPCLILDAIFRLALGKSGPLVTIIFFIGWNCVLIISVTNIVVSIRNRKKK